MNVSNLPMHGSQNEVSEGQSVHVCIVSSKYKFPAHSFIIKPTGAHWKYL